MLFCFHWLLLFRFGGLIGVNDRSPCLQCGRSCLCCGAMSNSYSLRFVSDFVMILSILMNLLEEWSDGLKQCGATDNTACASRYAWACVLHDVCTSGAVLGRDLLSGSLPLNFLYGFTMSLRPPLNL